MSADPSLPAAAGTRRGARWRLGRPELFAGIMIAAAAVAVLRREPIAAVLLSGVVVGFGLSGSV